MSQCILKCVICGGPHTILQCNNKCGVCNGDNRKCSCSERPRPQKKKRTAQSSSQSSSPDSTEYEELSKLYDNLLKEHKRVGLAFRNQQKELDESTKDADELADIVRTLRIKLAQAKKMIADLKTEVETLRSNNQQQQQKPQCQQHSSRVSCHSLAAIDDRYENVLCTLRENHCSMANAFRLAGCPRSTLRDFVGVAELKLVDSREHELVVSEMEGRSVKDLEGVCRKRLRRYLPTMARLRREGKLLPLKFEERFYE